jgi:hypothetical protein
MRVLRWGGVLPAAVAGILMLATVSETGLLSGPGAPVPIIMTSDEQAAARELSPSSEAPLWSKWRATRGNTAGATTTGQIAQNVDEMPPIVRPIQ